MNPPEPVKTKVSAENYVEHVLNIETFPEYVVRAVLFKEVTNSSQIKKSIINGSFPIECACFDASTVSGITLLISAISFALSRYKNDALLTKSLHTEILCSISPDRKISKALSQFGINDKSSSLLFINVNSKTAIFPIIQPLVQGNPILLSDAELDSLFQNSCISTHFNIQGKSFSSQLERDLALSTTLSASKKNFVINSEFEELGSLS